MQKHVFGRRHGLHGCESPQFRQGSESADIQAKLLQEVRPSHLQWRRKPVPSKADPPLALRDVHVHSGLAGVHQEADRLCLVARVDDMKRRRKERFIQAVGQAASQPLKQEKTASCQAVRLKRSTSRVRTCNPHPPIFRS
jgi:hypothetical protein